ncbi:MAG: DUF3109 family protein [Tannerellaceae bacterium]|jgi:hypothetical protein|nr:DUF3109 family protein [Tannerellaceae bacterium]
MFQIGEVLVSLDLLDTLFCCDLSRCRGLCCVEGDAGPPLAAGEADALQTALPVLIDKLSPAARETLHRRGICEKDADGDDVIPTVGEADCIFTRYSPDTSRICRCILEDYPVSVPLKTSPVPSCSLKPISCHLFPVVETQYAHFTALNVQHRKICRDAFIRGKRENIYLYRFLAAPLTRRFGADWYAELLTVAAEWHRHPRTSPPVPIS